MKKKKCTGCLPSPLIGVCLFSELKGCLLLLLQYHGDGEKKCSFCSERGVKWKFDVCFEAVLVPATRQAFSMVQITNSEWHDLNGPDMLYYIMRSDSTTSP